ncbi:MAG: DUF748 domain-containing protein [Pirellulales bacterium]|nr:DUF748 domain-containing protein [Pirellulales bacterium]
MAADVHGASRQDTEGREVKKTAKQRRRWPRRLGIFIVLLLVLIWFLPAILAKTPLLDWLVNRFGNLQGTVTIRSASLGWFSTPEVADVEILDARGRPVLEVSRAAGNRTLWELLRNLQDLGQFRVEKPKVHVAMGAEKTNIEEVFAYYISAPPSETPTAVQVEIADGEIDIADEVAKQNWKLDHLNLSLDVPAESTAAKKIKLSADVADPQRPGKLAVEGSLPASFTEPPAETGALLVQCDNFPLAVAQTLIQRFVPQTRIAGRLSSHVQCRWGEKPSPQTISVQAEAAVEEFLFGTPVMKQEAIRLDRLSASGRAAWSPEGLAVEKVAVESDVAQAELSGRFRIQGKESAFSLEALLRQPLSFHGRLDLARLAALLPGTLQIRQGTEITSGEVQITYQSRPAEAAVSGTIWHGELRTARLAAKNGNQVITWDQPISLSFDAHDTLPGSIVVDQLDCQSEFLQIRGSGTPENLAADANFQLEPLAARLGQFVDLKDYQLAGTGEAKLNWKRDAQQQFEAGARLQLHNLQVTLPGGRPWREENLSAVLAAKGQTDFTAATRVETGSLEVRSGTDRLTATLTPPKTEPGGGDAWSIHAELQGPLENWQARTAPFLPLDDWRIAGQSNIDAQAVLSKDSVRIERLTADVASLHVVSSSLDLEEPQVRLAAAGSWDAAQRRLQLTTLQLATTALAAAGEGIEMALPENGPIKLQGTVNYQGELARLRLWFIDRSRPPTWNLGGHMVGSLRFQQSPGLIQCDTTADVTNLTVNAAGDRFQEPKAKLVAQGAYDTKGGVLNLQKIELASATVAANLGGRLTAGAGDAPMDADVKGQVTYNLDRVCAMLRPYLGQNVNLSGQGTGPVAWQGPLSLGQGKAHAALGWQSAYLYGFTLGPGEVKPSLAQGVVQIEPLQLAVGQGRLLLNPRLRMNPEPLELTLPAGPVAQQVQVTPAVCATFLKYVAPVLAESTSVQGSFSLELEKCRLPLGDLNRGEMVGRLTVHSIEIGPGPLIRELATLLGRESPAQLRREAVIPFRLADGRVYHEGMELLFPNATVRTSGSVGLDQTLDLTVEMPVPSQWLANNPLASSLRNQTIRIPIGGTLKRPALDRGRVKELSRQFIRDTARNVLEEGFKGLDELLKPKKK